MNHIEVIQASFPDLFIIKNHILYFSDETICPYILDTQYDKMGGLINIYPNVWEDLYTPNANFFSSMWYNTISKNGRIHLKQYQHIKDSTIMILVSYNIDVFYSDDGRHIKLDILNVYRRHTINNIIND